MKGFPGIVLCALVFSTASAFAEHPCAHRTTAGKVDQRKGRTLCFCGGALYRPEDDNNPCYIRYVQLLSFATTERKKVLERDPYFPETEDSKAVAPETFETIFSDETDDEEVEDAKIGEQTSAPAQTCPPVILNVRPTTSSLSKALPRVKKFVRTNSDEEKREPQKEKSAPKEVGKIAGNKPVNWRTLEVGEIYPEIVLGKDRNEDWTYTYRPEKNILPLGVKTAELDRAAAVIVSRLKGRKDLRLRITTRMTGNLERIIAVPRDAPLRVVQSTDLERARNLGRQFMKRGVNVAPQVATFTPSSNFVPSEGALEILFEAVDTSGKVVGPPLAISREQP